MNLPPTTPVWRGCPLARGQKCRSLWQPGVGEASQAILQHLGCYHSLTVNSLLPGDTIWCLTSWSTLVCVMATVEAKNFHGSSDICLMGFIIYIFYLNLWNLSIKTFGTSRQQCPRCSTFFAYAVAWHRTAAKPLTESMLTWGHSDLLETNFIVIRIKTQKHS